jgi:DNA-binding transcriptional ArsR family regulator
MDNNQKRLSAVFSALSDPTRRQILARLARAGEGPVTGLAKPFRISLPAISRHIRVLERARLIGRRREGRNYLIHARRDGLKPAQDWIARYADAWEFSFDRLDALLAEEQQQQKIAVKRAGTRRRKGAGK